MNLKAFFPKQIILIEIWISKSMNVRLKKKKNPLRKVNSSFKKYDRYLFENMTVGNK